MVLRRNSRWVGERTPGAFLPRIIGLSRAEIVRGRSLSSYPGQRF